MEHQQSKSGYSAYGIWIGENSWPDGETDWGPSRGEGMPISRRFQSRVIDEIFKSTAERLFLPRLPLKLRDHKHRVLSHKHRSTC